MKRFFSILCCIVILLSMVGCKTPKDLSLQSGETIPTLSQNPTDNSTDPTEPSEPKPPVVDGPITQIPTVSISMPKKTESFTAKNGTILLEYVYPNTDLEQMLIMLDPQVSDNIKINLMNRIESTYATRDQLLSQAKLAYTNADAWVPYQYTVEYDPQRIDSGVLSFLTYETTFDGYRPDKKFNSVNFNMTTGQDLSLYNILLEKEMVSQVCTLTVKALEAQKDTLYRDYESTVRDHFNGEINDKWYFSPNGLCFYFEPADIAPTAIGVVTAEISYSKLAGILRDEYFPAERISADGKIEMSPFNIDNISDFNNFSELILDAKAPKVLLFTQKAAYDIKIDIGTRTQSGVYRKDYGIFAQSSLTPGDAIMVSANLSDDTCLHIQYLSGSETKHAFLIWDAETNRIKLIEQS